MTAGSRNSGEIGLPAEALASMIQRRGSPSFALEPFKYLRIMCEVVWQELQGHKAVKASIFGFVDNAHPATAELLQDSIVRNSLANHLVEGGAADLTSNEPPNNKDPDIAGAAFGTDDRMFSLRSERGTGNGSPGRIYTVTYRVTDKSGNATVKSAIVTVPTSNSGH
jgi:hypothetical protein